MWLCYKESLLLIYRVLVHWYDCTHPHAHIHTQSDNQIAVLEAQGAEVTRDDHDEVIVYATSLSATDTKYRFCNEEINPDDDDKTSVLLQGNEIVVLRVDGLSEVFGTGDFNTQEIED